MVIGVSQGLQEQSSHNLQLAEESKTEHDPKSLLPQGSDAHNFQIVSSDTTVF